MDLESISETSQKRKKHCMISLLWGIYKAKLTDKENRCS